MIDYYSCSPTDETKDLEDIAKEEQFHALHKRCWTSGSLNPKAVGDYAKYILDNVCEDWVKAEHILYAKTYISMIERSKSRGERRR